MRVSPKGISIIKNFEQFMPKAYLCPGNVWSIGYGHTENVHQDMVINKQEAHLLLKKDIKIFEDVVNSSVSEKIKLNQNQFDALVSLAYNIGGTAFKNSTLLKKINNGNIQEAANHFLEWTKVNGISLAGLTKRRVQERSLFLS